MHAAEPPAPRNAAWCRTPVDRFVLAKLEAAQLTPNGHGRRAASSIRRAYFDLIGLPPTPEEVEAFVADTAADAYDRLIDRLLASPHYGERWARHWLDLARFAESHGFEQDYDRPSAYHYRDFVIQALNDDMPYDRFVRWQIAGDEFEPDNNLALMATGFLAAGAHATQITANQVEKERYDELDDMAATVGTSMLGLTDRLRPLPRPQVRPDSAGRLLPASVDVHHHGPQRSRARFPSRGVSRGQGRRSTLSMRRWPKRWHGFERDAAARPLRDLAGRRAQDRHRRSG